MSDVIAQCLAGLQQDRAQLSDKLARIDAAIRSINVLLSHPEKPSATKPAAEKPSKRLGRSPKPALRTMEPRGDSTALQAKCIEALQANGEALSTGALAHKVGAAPFEIRDVMDQLAKRDLVYSTGKTSGQRWRLGAAPAASRRGPAKEVP